MDEKGIFTKEQEKVLANKLDDALNLKGFPELIDGLAARVLIGVIDDQVVDKLKAEIKVKLAGVAEAALSEDVEATEQAASDLLNSLIDIPGLDEDAEGLIFKGAVELLVGAVLKWVKSKKADKA